MTPFDFVNTILQSKTDLMTDDLSEKEYLPWIVNKSLSYHMDCVMFVNEMNQRPLTDRKLQYGYLLGVIRSRKRPFQKWLKRPENDDIEVLQQIYGFSKKKAESALSLISPSQLTEMKEKLQTGGMKKSK